MKKSFADLDIGAVTMAGLSTPGQRHLGLVVTFLIWIGVGLALWQLAGRLNSSGMADEAGLLLASGILLHYCLTGHSLARQWANWLVELTPIGVLYRRDKEILGQARVHLLEMARAVNLQDYMSYGKINPAIRTLGHLQVIEHQQAGDLEDWAGQPKHLKYLADLLFQLAIVDRHIAAGDYPNPLSRSRT